MFRPSTLHFQLLMINDFPCRYDNILVLFFMKKMSGTKMHLISLLMCAKFEGNPITCLHFMALFSKCAGRKIRKSEELSVFLKKKALSQKSSVICFRSNLCSFLTWQHLYSKFSLVQTRDHRATNGYFVFHINILMLCMHALKVRL